MTTKLLFMLAVVAVMAIVPSAYATDGERRNSCERLSGDEKTTCRIQMITDRINLMEKRHTQNNDATTPQIILDQQALQLERANTVLELLEQPRTADTKEEIKDLVFFLGEGCDRLKQLWQQFRQGEI